MKTTKEIYYEAQEIRKKLPPLDAQYREEYKALAQSGYGWGTGGNGEFIAAELRCRERQLLEALKKESK